MRSWHVNESWEFILDRCRFCIPALPITNCNHSSKNVRRHLRIRHVLCFFFCFFWWHCLFCFFVFKSGCKVAPCSSGSCLRPKRRPSRIQLTWRTEMTMRRKILRDIPRKHSWTATTPYIYIKAQGDYHCCCATTFECTNPLEGRTYLFINRHNSAPIFHIYLVQGLFDCWLSCVIKLTLEKVVVVEHQNKTNINTKAVSLTCNLLGLIYIRLFCGTNYYKLTFAIWTWITTTNDMNNSTCDYFSS